MTMGIKRVYSYKSLILFTCIQKSNCCSCCCAHMSANGSCHWL